ncbi:MAG: phytase [Polyangiaceae bacterium]
MRTSLLRITALLALSAGVAGAAEGVAHAAEASVTVAASFETEALFDDEAGGDANADDPAIWLHPTNPRKSLIFGTKKSGGLGVYGLSGATLQSIAAPPAPGEDDSAGRFNNVDVVYGFQLGSKRVDLAVVTDRGRDQIRFYAIDPSGATPLTDVTAASVPFVFSTSQAEVNEQATAYGLATRGARGRKPALVFASQRHGLAVAKLALFATPQGRVSYVRVGTVRVPSQFKLRPGLEWTPCSESDDELPQVEGMVIDTERDVLYMAQEDVGIWSVAVDAPNARPQLVDRVREFGVPYDRVYDADEEEYVCTLHPERDPGYGGKHLSADAEGLTIYYGRGGQGYLLASSQGDSKFIVYERSGRNRYVGSFEVGATSSIDGAQHSDGAAVLSTPLGPDFPFGLFVTQDGENDPVELDAEGEPREGTNFKLVPWEDIASAFSCPLAIDTQSYDPRR